MSSHLYLYVRVFSYLPKRWFLLFSCSAVLFWMRFASIRSQNMRRFFTTLRCTICPKLACVGDPHEWGGGGSKGIITPRPQGSIYKKYYPAFLFPGVRSIPLFGFRSIPVFCSCVFAAFPCFNCFVLFPWVLVQYTYTYLTKWGVKIWRISARRFFTTLRCEICPNLDFVGDPHEWGVERKNNPPPTRQHL